MGGLLHFFDGNWIDIASFAVAIAYAILRWWRSGNRKLVSKETGIDVANGVGIFPLFLLATTSLSSSARTALLQSNKLFLSVAGVVALLAILEDQLPSTPNA